MKPHLVGIIKEVPEQVEMISFPKYVVGGILLLLFGYVAFKSGKKIIPAALLSTACASSTVPLAIKPIGFTPSELQIIKDSAQQWSDKSDGRYTIIIDENCPEDVCSTMRKVSQIEGNSKASGVCNAYDIVGGVKVPGQCESRADYDLYEIDLANDDSGWYNFKNTVLHEMGHMFGKKDMANTNQVMSESDDTLTELTPADIQ